MNSTQMQDSKGSQSDNLSSNFLQAACGWLCDGYSADVRYIASSSATNSEMWSASIVMTPLPPKRADFGFHFAGTHFSIGQIQRTSERKAPLLELLQHAIHGEVKVDGRSLSLACNPRLDYYSEMTIRDRWYSNLHIQVLGRRLHIPSSLALSEADNELRLASPPFDGLADVCNWLDLSVPGSIALRVLPPVDLIFAECHLSNRRLSLTLHAHPRLDVSRVRLAVCAAPSLGLESRQQISEHIRWKKAKDGRRAGEVQVDVPEADSAIAMLMIENVTVRRQWFMDPTKARNNRYLAVQHYDNDLRMVRHALLESNDSVKFEQGVASMLFLLGFTPSIQVETNAPDLIVTTPSGKLAIVECTTRTSDFATKVGKLVDRRSSLSKHLAAGGHIAEVNAVLVCRLPRDQLPTQASEAARDNVLLLTGEDLQSAFERVRAPRDPDELLTAANSRLKMTAGFQQRS